MERITIKGSLSGLPFEAKLERSAEDLRATFKEGGRVVRPRLEFCAPLRFEERYFKAWINDFYRIEGQGRKVSFE